MVTGSYLCHGCPAEKVARNIFGHQDLSPAENGLALLSMLTIATDQAIAHGNVTGSAMRWYVAYDDVQSKIASLPDQQGDLTKRDIESAVVACRLRQLRGFCTLNAKVTDYERY